MSTAYSLDPAIQDFFLIHTDASREECDEIADSLLQSTILPVPIQGCFSYTVANHAQLVQFRASVSPLDIAVLERAREIHGSLVPRTLSHGKIGRDKPLSVYIIDKLPGVTFMEFQLASGLALDLGDEQLSMRKALIEDLARLFATSWKTPQAANTFEMRGTFSTDLTLLAKHLPSRFTSDIDNLAVRLDCVFESLPMVLTHGDLCEMNFLVNNSNGHLTGLIDWAEAEVLPFGCNLWAVENVLGYMDDQGWHYVRQQGELRNLFWATFYASMDDNEHMVQGAIELARQMGVLFRYGFEWGQDTKRKVVQEEDSGVRYLDALFLKQVNGH